MLNITQLLHEAIELDWQLDEDHEIQLGAEARVQNVFTLLDVKMAELAENAGWFKVWQDQPQQNRQAVLEKYTEAMNYFLLFSAKKQWTHLVVLDEEMLKRIKAGKQNEKVPDWNKEYLAIKNFLYGSYFEHRQEDFRHAWHLFLKLGMVDFGFTDSEITTTYEDKIKHLMQND